MMHLFVKVFTLALLLSNESAKVVTVLLQVKQKNGSLLSILKLTSNHTKSYT